MNKRFIFFCIALFCGSLILKGQDTFSIVAVDSVTGEVGSAGASCLGSALPDIPNGAIIISDVMPGKGAIHTQALWDGQNQQYAHQLLLGGKSPAQIINLLKYNDAAADSTIRQYGIVSLNGGHPLTAAYTGSGCSDYKNHIVGKYYTIQGNILLGRKVLDSMEYRFLNTKGTLADRLMAALQGAKMRGADTRCYAHNSSSLSSFLRVARPSDDSSKLYIDLHMTYPNNLSGNVILDPIDSLQHMYTKMKTGIEVNKNTRQKMVRIFYINNIPCLDLNDFKNPTSMQLEVFDNQGRKLFSKKISSSNMPVFDRNSYAEGIYIYRLSEGSNEVEAGKVTIYKR
jgi:uncharacterized Ntn-hydrolase superfamily protein